MLTGGIESLMSGRERVAFERTVVPPFLTSRRWFGAKGSRIRAVKVIDCAALKDVDGSARFLLPRLQVQLANGERQDYFMPVGVEEGREDETLLPFAVARVRRGPRTGLLYGAAGSNDFAACLIDDMRQGRRDPRRRAGASSSPSPRPSIRPSRSTWPTSAGSRPSRATPRSPSARR